MVGRGDLPIRGIPAQAPWWSSVAETTAAGSSVLLTIPLFRRSPMMKSKSLSR
jgi:hypothetical protein